MRRADDMPRNHFRSNEVLLHCNPLGEARRLGRTPQ
jgi:hypothetical protein